MKCVIDDCNNECEAQGLCNKHYKQFRIHGVIQPISRHEYHGGIHIMPEYNIWGHIIQRCTNPKYKRYKDYGGRGIKVCDRYRHSFTEFFNDVGPRPEGTSIDRKDNDGHYSCGKCDECIANRWTMNVKWSIASEQQINKRVRVDNTSGYKDITWNKRQQYWGLAIQREGTTIYTGWFDKLDDAVEARDAVLKKYNEYKDLDKNTYASICIDKRRIRSKLSGERNPEAKLTWEKVRKIRELWLKGGLYQTEIAKMFEVDQPQVGRIVLNLSWKDDEYAPKIVRRHKWETKRTKDELAS